MKITRQDLKKVPERKWVEGGNSYKKIYLVPSGLKHESGYMKVAIVGMKDDGKLEVCAYPDDINWDFSEFGQKYSCTGMRTDCYYPSGLLQFWGNGLRFLVGEAYSSTDIKVINEPSPSSPGDKN